MSQHPASPEQPEQPDQGHGTFLGGEFGSDSDVAEGEQSTAQQIETEQERPAYLADPLAAPAGAEELVTEPSEPGTFDSDVEGLSGAVAPGERNEPV